MDTVRLDKWLWAARFFKTRTQATTACDGGGIKVNECTAKPARPVKVGDRVEGELHERRRILVVTGLGERRGSAEIARTLYDDLTPPEPEPETPPVFRERGAGRPTKRDRRRLSRLDGDRF